MIPIFLLLQVFALYVGGQFIILEFHNLGTGRKLSAGDVLSCLVSLFSGFIKISKIFYFYRLIQEGQIAANVVFDIIQRWEETKRVTENQELQTFKGCIEMRGVRFDYIKNNKESLLKDITLKFDSGK